MNLAAEEWVDDSPKESHEYEFDEWHEWHEDDAYALDAWENEQPDAEEHESVPEDLESAADQVHGFLVTEVAIKAKAEARVVANVAVTARRLRRHVGEGTGKSNTGANRVHVRPRCRASTEHFSARSYFSTRPSFQTYKIRSTA